MSHDPRRVRAVPAAVGAILLVLGATAAIVGWRVLQVERRYRREGIVTDATVTGKRMVGASSSPSNDTRYEVSYRFAPRPGETVAGSDSIPGDVWMNLHDGSAVAIAYLASDPSVNRAASTVEAVPWVLPAIGVALLLAGGTTVAFAVGAMRPPRVDVGRVTSRIPILPVVGLMFFLFGVPFVAAAGLQLYRDHRLAAEGVRTTGTVVGKGSRRSTGHVGPPTAGTWGDSTNLWVNYRFSTQDGRVVEGRDDRVPGSTWSRLRELGPVAIAYLPADPQQNRVLPHASSFSGILLLALGAVFAGLGMLALAQSWRRKDRPRSRTRQTRV